MKRLQLRYFTGESAEVLLVTFAGLNEAEESLGTVSFNRAGLWSARAQDGSNHGDRYTSKWNAAKQLALGLGKGDFVQ